MNRAKLTLIYDGIDISRDIGPFVLSFSYTDHEGGKADDLQIRLEDREGLWKLNWLPRKGAVLKAFITSNFSRVQTQLTCGTFAIDEIEPSGPPDTVTLKAVSSLTAKSLKREKKSRSWENVPLSLLADQIAKEHGLIIFYDVDEVVNFTRVDQRRESDLAFLKRLSDDNDLSLKISGEKIIIFEGKKLEDAAPVFFITRGKSKISRYGFSSKTHDIYRACEITYFDADEKEDRVYSYVPPNPPVVGQILKINQRVESRAEAVRIAKLKLRRKNKHEIKADFELMGDTVLLAGLTGTISGWGSFDGKYIIEEAGHNQSRSAGYQTRMTMRKVLEY